MHIVEVQLPIEKRPAIRRAAGHFSIGNMNHRSAINLDAFELQNRFKRPPLANRGPVTSKTGSRRLDPPELRLRFWLVNGVPAVNPNSKFFGSRDALV